METIAPYVPGLLLVYSAFLLAVMSPGPGVLALMGTSMHSGRKAGVCFAVGIVLGSITWGTLTVAGLSVVMAKFGYLLFLIKIFGGCYLLWMACKAFRSATTRQELAARVAPASLKPRQLILRGYLVMLTRSEGDFQLDRHCFARNSEQRALVARRRAGLRHDDPVVPGQHVLRPALFHQRHAEGLRTGKTLHPGGSGHVLRLCRRQDDHLGINRARRSAKACSCGALALSLGNE
ncbi:LysE family translocator [Roseibium salinum]|nr:LysE family translocator [Roseibium salinum]